MTTDPNGGVTCVSCGLSLPVDVAYRAGELGDNGWTCNVCLAGGIEAILDQAGREVEDDES
jgi:hypothetical protein